MKNSIEINGTELTINGKTVVMSVMRMKLFELLLAGNGKVVKEIDLMRALRIMSRHTLNQHVSLLRKSLSVFDELRIVTMAKVGYCLKIKGEQGEDAPDISITVLLDGDAINWLIDNEDKYKLVSIK